MPCEKCKPKCECEKVKDAIGFYVMVSDMVFTHPDKETREVLAKKIADDFCDNYLNGKGIRLFEANNP